MKQRGRVSSAALAVPSAEVIERVPRQKAPHDLTDEETEIWVSVVDSEPADWFSPATVPLLTQFCRHAVHARRIAELLERYTSDKDLTVAEYDKLLVMQERESRALNALGRAMRLNQNSTINKRGNKIQTAKRKLWEPV